MVGPRLILILGDQLTDQIAALKAADRNADVIVMAEVMREGQSVAHHPQKIALILAAMRHFAEELRADGWQVAYSTLDDPQNSQSIGTELMRRAHEFGANTVMFTHPGEWRLLDEITDLPLETVLYQDDRFICSHAEFSTWAKDRKQLRMEYFYRDMRRKTGLLMDGDQPVGGQWNYDQENRKAAKSDIFRPKPLAFEPDPVTEQVLALVESRFAHFGALRPFHWAVTRKNAQAALAYFVQHALPRFGDEQDAMLQDDPVLSHSLLSPYIHLGLLSPMEVCLAAQEALHRGHAPLNAVEGFIRQIIGWREYMRGIWAHHGPAYIQSNALAHDRDLPAMYWGAPTKMRCISMAVAQTKERAYAHHIQRLMVTGNFALLAGVDPAQVHEWYLAVYIDAFEWVEAPNVIGMSQFADDGIVGSKPYVSSGAYINKMSDYCKGCHYKVATKTGLGACPFNFLYWDFLVRHKEKFIKNPRMGQMYWTWEKMPALTKDAVLADARVFLAQLDAKQVV